MHQRIIVGNNDKFLLQYRYRLFGIISVWRTHGYGAHGWNPFEYDTVNEAEKAGKELRNRKRQVREFSFR